MFENLTIASFLVTWLPIIVIMGVWVYFMRKMGVSGSGLSYQKYLELHLEEMRRRHDQMERPIAILAERADRKP